MNQFSTDIRRGTYKKFSGMYLGEEFKPEVKENHNILITTYPDQNSAYQAKIGEYKRNTKYHRKGDSKYETHYRKWIQIYPNILKAWESVITWPTVSWGLTCNQRNVFVVDVDRPFENLEEAEEYILGIKNISPSYIIRNPSSGHIQFGYVYREPVWVWEETNDEERHIYNKLTKRLAKIFHSDECFSGPACKNPFYVGFESKIFRDENNNFKIYNIKDLKELFMLSGERDSDELNLSQQSVAISSKELGNSSEEKNNEKEYLDLIKYYFGNILISPFSFFLFYIITNNLVEYFNENNLVDKVNSLQQIACTDGLALAKTDAQSDNHVRTYMKILRNKIFAYFRKNKQKLEDENILKQFEKETIQEMEEQGWVFNNMRQTLDATKKIQKWCNTKGWASFSDNSKVGITVKDSLNKQRYGVNTRRKSLETRHNRKLEKISKFREWMSENESKVWRKRCKAKEGFLNLKECAELVGISLQEFKQYLKLIDIGEITIERRLYEKETINSNRSNSEDEFVQGGIKLSQESPVRIEGEIEGEEFGNNVPSQTIERGVSRPPQEIQEFKKIA